MGRKEVGVLVLGRSVGALEGLAVGMRVVGMMDGTMVGK